MTAAAHWQDRSSPSSTGYRLRPRQADLIENHRSDAGFAIAKS
ncbi:hypothetical protein ABIE89_000125 [Bradyrhizobium niftali]